MTGWTYVPGNGNNNPYCKINVPMPENCATQNRDGTCYKCKPGYGPWGEQCLPTSPCT